MVQFYIHEYSSYRTGIVHEYSRIYSMNILELFQNIHELFMFGKAGLFKCFETSELLRNFAHVGKGRAPHEQKDVNFDLAPRKTIPWILIQSSLYQHLYPENIHESKKLKIKV